MLKAKKLLLLFFIPSGIEIQWVKSKVISKRNNNTTTNNNYYFVYTLGCRDPVGLKQSYK